LWTHPASMPDFNSEFWSILKPPWTMCQVKSENAEVVSVVTWKMSFSTLKVQLILQWLTNVSNSKFHLLFHYYLQSFLYGVKIPYVVGCILLLISSIKSSFNYCVVELSAFLNSYFHCSWRTW
jgi:hypothetical protein